MFHFFDNNFLNAITVIMIFIVCLFIFLYALEKVLKFVPLIKTFFNRVISHFYLILIPFPAIYLVYYNAHIDGGVLSENFPLKDEVADILSQLSIYFFTVGIFSGFLKYINTITFVKNKVRDIILSKEFDDKLTNKLEVFAYSDESLSKHENIEELWERVTLLKYKNNFPGIYNKLRTKINNELFSKEATPYYYKNFFLDIQVKLEGDIMVIEKTTRYTVIRPSEEKFSWNFRVEIFSGDLNNPDIDLQLHFEDEIVTKFDKHNTEIEKFEKMTSVTYEKTFEGSNEYDIKTIRASNQNITEDRFCGFGTNRIIDYLEVNLYCCDKLNAYFTELNKIKFEKSTLYNGGFKYVCREIITPSDIFKIFFTKKE